MSFLTDACVDTREFENANDLLNDKPLIFSLTSLAYTYTEFFSLKKQYDNGQTFNKKSNLKSQLDEVVDAISEFPK